MIQNVSQLKNNLPNTGLDTGLKLKHSYFPKRKGIQYGTQLLHFNFPSHDVKKDRENLSDFLCSWCICHVFISRGKLASIKTQCTAFLGQEREPTQMYTMYFLQTNQHLFKQKYNVNQFESILSMLHSVGKYNFKAYYATLVMADENEAYVCLRYGRMKVLLAKIVKKKSQIFLDPN